MIALKQIEANRNWCVSKPRLPSTKRSSDINTDSAVHIASTNSAMLNSTLTWRLSSYSQKHFNTHAVASNKSSKKVKTSEVRSIELSDSTPSSFNRTKQCPIENPCCFEKTSWVSELQPSLLISYYSVRCNWSRIKYWTTESQGSLLRVLRETGSCVRKCWRENSFNNDDSSTASKSTTTTTTAVDEQETLEYLEHLITWEWNQRRKQEWSFAQVVVSVVNE